MIECVMRKSFSLTLYNNKLYCLYPVKDYVTTECKMLERRLNYCHFLLIYFK